MCIILCVLFAHYSLQIERADSNVFNYCPKAPSELIRCHYSCIPLVNILAGQRLLALAKGFVEAGKAESVSKMGSQYSAITGMTELEHTGRRS